MYKPDEKDIDRLSREAAEHYHAPGKPAWDALQQVLDKELPQKEERKRRGFFFFFFLLLGLSLTGSVLWYGIQNIKNRQHTVAASAGAKDKNSGASIGTGGGAADPAIPVATGGKAVPPSGSNPVKNAPEKSAEHAAGDKAGEPVAVLPVPGDKATVKTSSRKNAAQPPATTVNTTHRPAVNTAVSKITGTTPANTHKKIKTPVIIPPGTVAARKDKSPVTENSRRRIPANENITVTEGSVTAALKHGRNGKKTSPVLANTVDDKDNAENNGISASGSVGEGTTGKSAAQKQKDSPATAAMITADTDTASSRKTIVAKASATTPGDEQNDSAKTARKKNTVKNNKAINIGLVAGMDISTVKFTHGDNAGYNLGLIAGYQFSRHWSVYTGIIYTKKNYKLDGSDYHPPKHYWTQYVTLESVEGYCRMWELPLQARYTFNPAAKTAFFASAGLSSYFMKKQQYNYSYKNNMNQPLTAAWSNDSTFKHVFSILHLSAGFEKRLGRHMNWQIEPYAKIPLGGVGFGNIRLSSFGVNFSVQYRQRIRR